MGPDEALTCMYARPEDKRREFLGTLPTALLERVADLCGVDAIGKSRKQLITSILENF